MKSFRKRLQTLNESNLSKEAQALHDRILPLLKPMQRMNYYWDNGDEIDDNLYQENFESIKLLEKMLADPELKQEHFNEAMLHLVPRRHVPEDHMRQLEPEDTNFRTRHVQPIHTFRILAPVFTALPIGKLNNFLQSLPENFIRENADKEEIQHLHYHIISNSRHTPETLKKSMLNAYSDGVTPDSIREAIRNPKESTYSYNSENHSRLNDPSVALTMRSINDHHQMEYMFGRPPFMTNADRRKIDNEFDYRPRGNYGGDDDD